MSVAGCGDDEGDATTPTASPGDSALELTLDPDGPGGKPAMKERLDCEGDVASDSADACQQLLALSPADLDPVPPDMACTEIYGGPDTLEVSGTLDGEQVEATLTRENGCEIARFDPWVPILRDLFPDYRPGESLTPS